MPDVVSSPRSRVLCLALLALASAPPCRGGEARAVRGRVVDEAGRPVAGAAVADFWRANGTGKGPDGKYLDLKVEANVRAFWGHLGEMEPLVRQAATTGADGRFAVEVSSSKHALMAMDRDRRKAGLAILPMGEGQDPIEIRIGPPVKVRGSFRSPGDGPPGWTHVYCNLPGDDARPIDSTRLVSCGSFEGRFEFSVPPGRYVLVGYDESDDARLVPDREIAVEPGRAELDLGVLTLADVSKVPRRAYERAKDGAGWVDVADRYGKPAPGWHLDDARGIARDARIEDFRGKWLLVYFWGFGCAPCLGTELPSLSRFYEAHAADRGRFEVVAVCTDDDARSMADVDRRLEPIVRNAWGGKPLPFPTALDTSYRTMEAFGLRTLGPQLVDPEGILRKGGERELAKVLDAPGGSTSPRR
ncbi:Thiol-disulfide oxidoreductase ResA [Aquisphaera giovannonii]|uniref:Thiol-disulfide oxidoreductase ResA n=1 Tax=Aquisphaera giovannonii TaxID=406548 RepID=A0A5B9W4K9_9BACT|nr:TlpA disulfide reductase family protein [Aquisphaera giovannonii]QEH35576.1 Thiol-disulfide oxidoreductase ResA [Aquisphaera giovannonii]